MTTEPRVLHVVEAVEGGTIRYAADLVSNVRGVEHVVAAPSRRSTGSVDGGAMERIAAHARLLSLPMTRFPLSPGNARSVAAVRRLIDSERADAVHAHSTIAGVVARTTKLPVPVIYTPNGLQPLGAAMRLERLLAPRTDAFVAVSPSEAEEVRAHRLVPEARLFTIPNGIGPEEGHPTLDLRSHLGLPATTPVFGTAIRLVRQKAPEVFVGAAERVLEEHPGAHAVLIGDGPLRGAVERAVARSPHTHRLHMLGYLPEASTVLPQLDVFALASRFEGMPYALLEAMRAGVAVVVSDVAGNRDAVADHVSGLVVPSGDAGSMAAAISRLLADSELRGAFGRSAAARVADRFSLSAMTEAHEALYAGVMARRAHA